MHAVKTKTNMEGSVVLYYSSAAINTDISKYYVMFKNKLDPGKIDFAIVSQITL